MNNYNTPYGFYLTLDQTHRDYFIKKFETIPEDEWCNALYKKITINKTARCAIGHCNNNLEINQLIQLTVTHYGVGPADITEGKDKRFKEKTPKQRILNALKNIPDI